MSVNWLEVKKSIGELAYSKNGILYRILEFTTVEVGLCEVGTDHKFYLNTNDFMERYRILVY